MKNAFLALLIFLATTSAAYGQPVREIPQGVNIFGPFSVNVLHRKVGWTFERVDLNPTFTSASITTQSTSDGVTWKTNCIDLLPTVTVQTPAISVDCPLLESATHFRIVTNVVGGQVRISRAPTTRSRAK